MENRPAPSITEIIAWMRHHVPTGDPGEHNSIKLLRWNHGFYETNKETLTSLIDDFERLTKTSLIEKPSPLQLVGVHLLLDMIGYDPKKYAADV